eukprot:1195515-Prorocentrum_minimum.AAC.18
MAPSGSAPDGSCESRPKSPSLVRNKSRSKYSSLAYFLRSSSGSSTSTTPMDIAPSIGLSTACDRNIPQGGQSQKNIPQGSQSQKNIPQGGQSQKRLTIYAPTTLARRTRSRAARTYAEKYRRWARHGHGPRP